MTPEQKAAFVMAQAACAMVEVAGMQAENAIAASTGKPITYDRAAFEMVMVRNLICHNDVIAFFRE